MHAAILRGFDGQLGGSDREVTCDTRCAYLGQGAHALGEGGGEEKSLAGVGQGLHLWLRALFETRNR